MPLQFLNPPDQFSDKENADYIILPAPYDGTSTWVKGADRGPDAIISASSNLELYDMETGLEAYKKGIHTMSADLDLTSPEKMTESIRSYVKEILVRDKFPVLLGGEHSVSIGAVRAAAEKYRNLSVLQLDAHADLRQEFEGSALNHACVASRIRDICPLVQCGIRSMDREEEQYIHREYFFPAHIIQGKKSWMKGIPHLLSKNVYITIDLDVFDPSLMPSTGTPEPGGLGWYEVLELLYRIFSETNVVGFDVVELCPGLLHAPDFLAAKLVYKLITYHAFFKARRGKNDEKRNS